MPQNRRKENRMMNRVRKRRAEWELLLGSNSRVAEQFMMDNNQKRAKETPSEEGEESEDEPCASSSVADIARTMCEAANAVELAREWSKELRKLRPKRTTFESKLQLHKLNGKTLSERELAAFLHRHLLGTLNTPNRAGANWLRFEGGRKPLQIVMVRVNCEDSGMLRTNDNAKFIDEYFGFKWVRLHNSVRDRHSFWHTISSTTFSLRELLIRKIQEFGDPLLIMRLPQRKAQLLMSLMDMTLAKYPFPTRVFDEPQSSKIRPTRTTYRSVSERSPIFVIDCEMCLTSDQRLELTRISMVNEAGETLIDELVKPYNKIVDYITFKSGITEKMLNNVHTRLKDIQKRVCALLTDDAILCGHSLENDLLALQLSHPFCIDTSLLFNFSGRPYVRSGLKALADIFLNEQIQDKRSGHCSLQDALATLKLLKLKLEKGLVFGNVTLGWNFAEWAAQNGFSIHGTRLDRMEKKTNVDGAEKEEDTGTKGGHISTDKRMETADEIVEEQLAVQAVARATLKEEKRAEGNALTEEKEGQENGGGKQKLNEERNEYGDGEEEKAVEKKEKREENNEEESEIGELEEKEGSEIGELEEKEGREEGSEIGELEETGHDCDGKGTNDNTFVQCTTTIADDNMAKFFDFNEALRIDNAMQQTGTLSECFHTVHGHRKSTKMLVAGRTMDAYFTPNESCVLMGLGDGEGAALSSQCADLAAGLMEYEVALIDLNCPAGTDKRELDDAFRHLVGGMCNNSFCLLLMVGLVGNGQESMPILYQRVHQRTTHKRDDGTTGGWNGHRTQHNNTNASSR